MRTLASVLDAAIQRSAAEITLESEQPVIYRTARGSEVEQTVLRRTELFDMLATAVSDEHQVELMLGNAIEFSFEAQRIKWWVRAVPGADAMVVRVEREGGAGVASLPDPDDLSIELDDGFGGLDAPPQLDDSDFDLGPPPARAGSRSPSGFAPTLSDDSPAPRRTRPPSEPVPTAFESGTWALEDDDDADLDAHAGTVAMPASDSTPLGRSPRFASAPELSAVEPRKASKSISSFTTRRTINDAPKVTDFIGVPADDDDSSRSISHVRPGTRARHGSASLAAVPAQGRTHSEMAPLASPDAATRRELTAVGSPEADTHRELNAIGHGVAGSSESARPGREWAADIAEGTLVYLLESGLAEQVVSALQAPTLVLDEQVDPAQLTDRVRALPTGSILMIQREDPSQLLGWILRRLEEGFRVFLDTRARSLEGARRILLGTSASERAEAWLAAHPQIIVESGESGPRVRSAALAS